MIVKIQTRNCAQQTKQNQMQCDQSKPEILVHLNAESGL